MVPGGNDELGPRLQEERGPAHLSAGLLLPALDLEPPEWGAAGPSGPIQDLASGFPSGPHSGHSVTLPCLSFLPLLLSAAVGVALSQRGLAEIKHFFFPCLLLSEPALVGSRDTQWDGHLY